MKKKTPTTTKREINELVVVHCFTRYSADAMVIWSQFFSNSVNVTNIFDNLCNWLHFHFIFIWIEWEKSNDTEFVKCDSVVLFAIDRLWSSIPLVVCILFLNRIFRISIHKVNFLQQSAANDGRHFHTIAAVGTIPFGFLLLFLYMYYGVVVCSVGF